MDRKWCLKMEDGPKKCFIDDQTVVFIWKLKGLFVKGQKSVLIKDH